MGSYIRREICVSDEGAYFRGGLIFGDGLYSGFYGIRTLRNFNIPDSDMAVRNISCIADLSLCLMSV